MKSSEVKQRIDDGLVYQIKLAKNDKVSGNWKDIVQGEVKMANGVKEIVLVKRDKRATRALADTVDDHEIKVSHAIRDQDAMLNTRLQIIISKLLEIDPPEFAHMPHLVNDKGTKISKE